MDLHTKQLGHKFVGQLEAKPAPHKSETKGHGGILENARFGERGSKSNQMAKKGNVCSNTHHTSQRSSSYIDAPMSDISERCWKSNNVVHRLIAIVSSLASKRDSPKSISN
ncbi:hypothetical protein J6590_068148 [Homalodisca vitripennis]|nr:hypothetical protein J6590_068148 [Homalodisca vitripennis]